MHDKMLLQHKIILMYVINDTKKKRLEKVFEMRYWTRIYGNADMLDRERKTNDEVYLEP